MRDSIDFKRVLNYRRYPIDQANHRLRAATVARARRQLAADGCAVIRGFFSPSGLETLRAEAEARQSEAYFSAERNCNVYLNDGDPAFAADHPRNRPLPRSNGFVTADLFGAETASRQLYDWPPLTRFIADCLGKPELYVYEDPVSNMIVNVARPGQQFNWHFDTNEFTITMLLRAATSGGIFEYVPGLRSADDECYDSVGEVLDGDRGRVRQLELNAGDLQLFLGRFSLHRVTENTGSAERLLLIMSYAQAPGMIGGKARVKRLYGKITDAHGGRVRRADRLAD